MDVMRWLEEKRARGVKQVRVESVLEQLANEPKPPIPPPTAPPPPKPARPTKLDAVLYDGENGERGKLSTGPLGLMGTWEVARYLGVEKSRVARWLIELSEGKAPIAPPVARLKSGSFWRFSDVEAKLDSMYAEVHHPYGKTVAGRQRWVNERRERREHAAA